MKKIIAAICATLLFTLTLCSCAPAVTFKTSGGQYDVVKISTAEQAQNHTAKSGNTLLSVTLKTDAKGLDDAQNAFMPAGGEPCFVSDDAAQYPCIELTFTTDGTAVQTTLLFEVPSNLPENKSLTLGGSSFTPVALKK
ncbi:MAG: hypothetical protein RR351_03985 [Christensenella sp.]